ncbi:MAG TPA: sodium:proton antiporter, partial [Desulfosarcina sp.]|nr:sodium:proton antiporter [Desulfosarcina sp.]
MPTSCRWSIILSLWFVAFVIALVVHHQPAWASDTQPSPVVHHDGQEDIGANASEDHPEADGHGPTGASGHHGHEDLGPVLPLWSCIPFACMLLSIALFPLVAPEFWHHHFGKVSAFWAAAMAVPFLVVYKGTALYEIIHIILADYVPFIILLWSLYTVSGGILLKGSLRGTPM